MLTHASRLASPRDVDVRTSERARLLIVRHGRDRGPRIRLRGLRPARYQPMFDDVANRFPKLGRCFRYWETGSPQPNLTDVRAILFVLQDPLQELHPECFQDASALAQRARDADVRMVNPPESLSNTIKSRQAKLWREAGIPTPECIGFSTVDQLREAAKSMDGPFVIKADRLHAQERTVVCQNFDELLRVADDRIPARGVVSPVVDTRRSWQDVSPGTPFATHFHKKRAMVFGDHVCNNHIFFAEQPIVGCVSSTFGHFRSMNPFTRIKNNRRYQSHFDCDFDYWCQEPEKPSLLSRAAKVLGVEFCAIDYSTHADGELVMWEANPFFSLHRWPFDVLGRKRRLPYRMPRVHDTAAMFFRDLMSGDS